MEKNKSIIAICNKDFFMESGPKAFKKDKIYKFKILHTDLRNWSISGKSEITDDHFMSYKKIFHYKKSSNRSTIYEGRLNERL